MGALEPTKGSEINGPAEKRVEAWVPLWTEEDALSKTAMTLATQRLQGSAGEEEVGSASMVSLSAVAEVCQAERACSR